MKSIIAGREISWSNVCTRPQDKSFASDEEAFYCHPSWLDLCSCGQVRPKTTIPGGTKQSLLFAPPPPPDRLVVGEAGGENDNLFSSALAKSPPASGQGLDGGAGGAGAGGAGGSAGGSAGGGEILLPGREKDFGFVPMGNVGDGRRPGTG